MAKHTFTDLCNMIENADEDALAEFGQKLRQELSLQEASPVTKLELFVTHQCNLRCDYCFLDGATRHGDMPLEIAQKSLDLLMKRSKSAEVVHLTLFGGEPLTRVDLMEGILETADRVAEENGKAITLSCTTNGLLLDDRAVELARKYRFNYLFSIDGNKTVHDQHRRTASGEGTYDKVIEKIRYLKRYQPWIGTRMTVTPDAVPYFAESIEELSALGVNQFLIDFLPDNSWQPDQLVQIKEQYRQVLDFYLAALKKGIPIRIGDGEHGALRPKMMGAWGCGGGATTISVSANGDVYGCSRAFRHDCLRMGNVTEGELDWDMNRFFWEWRPEVRWKCMSCDLTDYCSGGCPVANYEATRTPYYPTEVCCTVIRALTELEQENPRFAPLFVEEGEKEEAADESGLQPLSIPGL